MGNPALLIFTSQYHLSAWYQDDNIPGDWAIAVCGNGWTTNQSSNPFHATHMWIHCTLPAHAPCAVACLSRCRCPGMYRAYSLANLFFFSSPQIAIGRHRPSVLVLPTAHCIVASLLTWSERVKGVNVGIPRVTWSYQIEADPH